MGMADLFMADTRVELKVGDLYKMLDAAASNAKTAKFLLNGVKNEVPYKYIREIITGEKEEETDDSMIARAEIEIHAAEMGEAIKKTILSEIDIRGENEQTKEAKEIITDCAPGTVSCEDCPHDCEELAAGDESEGNEE